MAHTSFNVQAVTTDDDGFECTVCHDIVGMEDIAAFVRKSRSAPFESQCYRCLRDIYRWAMKSFEEEYSHTSS